MPRRKLPYQEGDWFAVPLQDGDWALGLAARVPNRSHGVFGYFFGPRHEHIPTEQATWGLTPADAIFAGIFSDLRLLNGKWPLVFRPQQWNREEWPLPAFGRIEADRGRGVRTEYDEKDLGTVVRAEYVSIQEAQRLPKDADHGYVSVQILLTRLLP